MTIQLLLGFLLGVLVAWAAYSAGALSRSGAIAAAVSGGLVFGLGGWRWAVLLLAFFVSSSALSRLFSRRKAALSEKFSKGSRRDWAQVLANGGLGAMLAMGLMGQPDAVWLWAAYAGAMAAVNADTWATELGVLNPAPPRLITNGRIVERGTSGGISLAGSAAAMGGASLIAVGAALLAPGTTSLQASLFAAAAIGGLGGSFFDSLLGATVQAIYWCPVCEKETEHSPLHSCGTPTVPQRGWRWMDNDWVNFLASLLGAIISLGVWLILNV